MGRGRRAIPLEPVGFSTRPDVDSPESYDDGHLVVPGPQGLGTAEAVPSHEAYAHRRETLARQARILGFLEMTDWERANSADYVAIFDEDEVTVRGWYRRSAGYEEICNRAGDWVWSDEIGLEEPLFSPLDLIGLGLGSTVARGIIRLGARFTARFVARGLARGVAEAASRRIAARVMAALRRPVAALVTRRLARRAATEGLEALARRAQELVRRLQSEGRRIVVNIGGEYPVGRDVQTAGEVARHAINLNPLEGRVSPELVENLVQGRAEDIASFFTRGQVDEIVTSRLQPGTMNWEEIIPGAARVLRRGGRIQINFQGGYPDEIREIMRLLERHGFREINRGPYPGIEGGIYAIR